MLPKKKLAHYKKLVIRKLEAAGIKDEIQYKVNGVKRILNAYHGQLKDKDGNLLANQGPKHFEVRTQQATNLQRSLLKRILSLPEEMIKTFLLSELQIEKSLPVPEKAPEVNETNPVQASTQINENEVPAAR
jgi:hypothetical protein